MSALPDDPAVLEDDDLVSADDRRHPLGDGENDRVIAVHGRRAARRRASVATSRAESRRRGERRAGAPARGRCQALPLVPETLVPPWAMRASSRRPMADEILGLGDPQRLPELVIGGFGIGIPRLLATVPVKEEVSADQTDARPDVLQGRHPGHRRRRDEAIRR